MNLWISPAHRAARLAGGGTQGFADLGALNSRIQFYASTQPAGGGSPGGAVLVEVELAKPCGTLVDAVSLGLSGIVGDVLVLAQLDPTGDQILVEGSAKWGRWVNGNGDIVADGDATDGAGDGFFKITGTTGTHLYAGARALLGETVLV